jgi:hypothetical protein
VKLEKPGVTGGQHIIVIRLEGDRVREGAGDVDQYEWKPQSRNGVKHLERIDQSLTRRGGENSNSGGRRT